ncbi:MAG: hypothetical protein IPM48_06620 [Saprospiraceae bacterium]|nr:hypothetical protein [Saprospiraceae bacterium]
MKTNILIITAILYFLNFSCIDSGTDDPNPPITKDSCIVYEPILDSISKVRAYTVIDSIVDFGYATKVNSISFFNFGAGRNPNGVDIHLFSQDVNGELADYLIFFIDNHNLGCYNLITDCYGPTAKVPLCNCAYFEHNHNDIVVDSYLLDTSRNDNKIEIVFIDTLTKIIEGRFACSFVFANDRPKRDPYNLDTMRFFNGYFKGKYKDR